MTELKTLKEQRKIIDKKIKELTTENVYVGRAKFYYDNNPGIAKFYCNVSVLVPELRRKRRDYAKQARYSLVCRGENKQDTISELEKVIDDLQKLYEKLMDEHADMAERQTPET